MGLLIPDEKYSQVLENYGIVRLLEHPELRECFGPDIDGEFLEAVQEAHDDAAVFRDGGNARFTRNTDEVFRIVLEDELRTVAAELGLEAPAKVF